MSDGNISAGLARVRRKRWYLWALLIAYLPAIWLSLRITRSDAATGVFFGIWCIGVLVCSCVAALAACPHCRHRALPHPWGGAAVRAPLHPLRAAPHSRQTAGLGTRRHDRAPAAPTLERRGLRLATGDTNAALKTAHGLARVWTRAMARVTFAVLMKVLALNFKRFARVRCAQLAAVAA